MSTNGNGYDPLGRLKNLPSTYLDCRDLRHAWQRLGAQWAKQDPMGFRELHRRLRCMRCDTVRTDIYAYPGYEKVRTVYDYPEDYQIPIGDSNVRLHTEDIREEVYRRITPMEQVN